jgi:hypothetical protein
MWHMPAGTARWVLNSATRLDEPVAVCQMVLV